MHIAIASAAFLVISCSTVSPKKGVVIIDPGHGGDDPGARSHGIIEASAAYDVSCRLKRNLEASGFEVRMTTQDLAGKFPISNAGNIPWDRKSVFVLNGKAVVSSKAGLASRTGMTTSIERNGEKVLAYISIHFDESANSGLYGAHFIVDSSGGGKFAEYLRDEFRRTGMIRQLGGKEYHSIVPNGSRMIAVRSLFVLNDQNNHIEDKVVAELGNIRSARDRKLIACPSGRQKYADLIASAVRKRYTLL